MEVREVMSPEVECLDPHMTLCEAAKKMKTLDIGSLPICKEGKIQGLLTDRDIVVRAIAEHLDPEICKVQDILTTKARWIYADQDIEDAEELMHKEQIRRLVVLDRDRKLVGILSLGDIAIKHDEDHAGKTLHGISQPGHSSHEGDFKGMRQ